MHKSESLNRDKKKGQGNVDGEEDETL